MILVGHQSKAVEGGLLNIKYRMPRGADPVRDAFVNFMGFRHTLADMAWLRESQNPESPPGPEEELNTIGSRMPSVILPRLAIS